MYDAVIGLEATPNIQRHLAVAIEDAEKVQTLVLDTFAHDAGAMISPDAKAHILQFLYEYNGPYHTAVRLTRPGPTPFERLVLGDYLVRQGVKPVDINMQSFFMEHFALPSACTGSPVIYNAWKGFIETLFTDEVRVFNMILVIIFQMHQPILLNGLAYGIPDDGTADHVARVLSYIGSSLCFLPQCEEVNELIYILNHDSRPRDYTVFHPFHETIRWSFMWRPLSFVPVSNAIAHFFMLSPEWKFSTSPFMVYPNLFIEAYKYILDGNYDREVEMINELTARRSLYYSHLKTTFPEGSVEHFNLLLKISVIETVLQEMAYQKYDRNLVYFVSVKGKDVPYFRSYKTIY